jgi:hypothetical protein
MGPRKLVGEYFFLSFSFHGSMARTEIGSFKGLLLILFVQDVPLLGSISIVVGFSPGCCCLVGPKK